MEGIKMLFLVLVIAMTFSAVAGKSTPHFELKVDYEITFECVSLKPFCVELFYLEKDWLTYDKIKKETMQCTTSNILEHNSHVVFSGNDGPYNYEYEPVLKIDHNCSMESNKMTTKVYLPEIKIRNGNFKQSLRVDLMESRIEMNGTTPDSNQKE